MQLSGTQILSPITPFDSRDLYPTHYDIYGNGGYIAFQSSGELLSIPINRQRVGMMGCLENQLYILQSKSSSLSFDNWLQLPISGVELVAERVNFDYYGFDNVGSALKNALESNKFGIEFFTVSGLRDGNYYNSFEYGTNDGSSLKFNWEYNRQETGQYIRDNFNNEYILETGVREFTYSSGLNDNIYTLYASSYNNENISSGVQLNFYHKIFYGESTKTSLINSDVLSLNVHQDSSLGSKNLSFTLKPENEYMYICYPYDFGDSYFNVNGIDTDFIKSSLTVTNSFAFPTNYYVFRSIYKVNSKKDIKIQTS
jgi:hypothetical protein